MLVNEKVDDTWSPEDLQGNASKSALNQIER